MLSIRKGKIMNVLIELPNWLGDCVMATPSIENLVSVSKNAKITFIGPKTSTDIFLNHPNYHSSIESERRFYKFFKISLKLDKFDIFISYRNSLRARFFKRFISAGEKYQYNKKIFKSGHQVEKYNNFINSITKKNLSARDLIIYSKNITPKKKGTVGINPGASYGSAKRWTSNGFSELAFELSKNFDILLFGTNQEFDLCSEIENYLIENNAKNYKNLCGKTSIQELISEIGNLDLFVTGDSGPMHIAAAFQTPTISIFGPTRSTETSQWRNKFSKIVTKNLDCQPCMKRSCPLMHHNCMRLITPNEVLEESLKLIREVKVDQMA